MHLTQIVICAIKLISVTISSIVLILLFGQQEGHLACKKPVSAMVFFGEKAQFGVTAKRIRLNKNC